MGTHLIESLESRRLLADTAIVRGTVFRDANHDAIRQSTEAGQANVKVYLDYNKNGVRDGDAEPIVVTNSTGGFRFEAARAPESPVVRLLLTGTNFVQSRPAANAGRPVTTAPSGDYEVESFGVYEPAATPPPPPTPTVTVLTGVVYTDLDRNGVRGSTEKGRANVLVYFDNNNDGVRQASERQVSTDAEGRYRFADTYPQARTLRLNLAGTNLEQTQPAGGAAVHVTVIKGSTTEAAPFGVAERKVTPPTPPASSTAVVRGTVFYDRNADAARNDGEVGRANVKVYLDLNNDGVRQDNEQQSISDSLGHFQFASAPVRNDLHLRLNLVGTNLVQTLPTGGGAIVLTTVAGGVYVDRLFGVHEVALMPV